MNKGKQANFRKICYMSLKYVDHYPIVEHLIVETV